jgi:hypothetical protein
MVKITGPLASGSASGSLSSQLTFSNANGVSYVKTYAKPKQPRTIAQQAGRTKMRAAVAAWKALSPAAQESWILATDAKQRSAYNAFLSWFLLQPETPATKAAAFPRGLSSAFSVAGF